MSRFSYFAQNPIQCQDGYSLKALDAVEIEKFMKGLKKGLNGGSFFIKKLSPMTSQEVAMMLYQAYEGRMPIADATRICQPDILCRFNLRVTNDGYVQEIKESLPSEIEEIFEKVYGSLNNDEKLLHSYPQQLQTLLMRGEDCDQISGATGEFGRSLTNPIPVNGPTGEIIYLSMLRTDNGMPIAFHRLGSIGKIDVFETISADGGLWDVFYFSFYHPRKSKQAPLGYKISYSPLHHINGTNKSVLGFPSAEAIKSSAMNYAKLNLGVAILPHPDLLNIPLQKIHSRPSSHFEKTIKAAAAISNSDYEARQK